VARLVADQGKTVMAYFDEDDLTRIQAGDQARFYADDPAGPVMQLALASIEPDARRTLREPELAHLFGGGILVREKNNLLYPERPIYLVTFKVLNGDASASQHTWRGKVVVHGAWSVPGWHYVRHAAAVIRREAGF
jgi:putative peptide zinc metalloprotease protein